MGHRIERVYLEAVRQPDLAQRYCFGDDATKSLWLVGPDRAPVEAGAIGRLVYWSSAIGQGAYRFEPYGISLSDLCFVNGPALPWPGVKAVTADMPVSHILDAKIVLDWRENAGTENPAFWVCVLNGCGANKPRVFGTETLPELLALLVDPPTYVPRRGDTLIIRPRGGEEVKGAMIGYRGAGQYTVRSYTDGREYTGERRDYHV